MRVPMCLAGTNTPDQRTLHTGTAVQQGEKWAVNKWIRERRIRLNYETESAPSAVHLGATCPYCWLGLACGLVCRVDRF